MQNSPDPTSAKRQALSSLMDGDLELGAASKACEAWRGDADARATWHAYQLIGDVLRSDDLAAAPQHDESFLQSLRGRLADEPHLLAPAPRVLAAAAPATLQRANGASAGAPAWRRAPAWLAAPVAVALGFFAVAGLLVVTRVMSPEQPDGGRMALATPSAQGIQGATSLVAQPALGGVLRNAGLDQYLEAHRSTANGAAAAGGAEHRVQIVFESK